MFEINYLYFFVLVFYSCLSEASHTICGMNTRLKAERERKCEKKDVLFQKLVIQFMKLAQE
jgi:hypothetical protein